MKLPTLNRHTALCFALSAVVLPSSSSTESSICHRSDGECSPFGTASDQILLQKASQVKLKQQGDHEHDEQPKDKRSASDAAPKSLARKPPVNGLNNQQTQDIDVISDHLTSWGHELAKYETDDDKADIASQNDKTDNDDSKGASDDDDAEYLNGVRITDIGTYTNASLDDIQIYHISFSHRFEDLLGKLSRPGWQKFLRCSGNTPDTCEECSPGASSCWSFGDSLTPYMEIDFHSDAFFSRFLSIVHVTCRNLNKNWLDIRLGLQEIRDGRLSMYWDGTEMISENGFTVYNLPIAAPKELIHEVHANARVGVDRRSGHELTIEFKVQGSLPQAKIGDIVLEAPSDFATCQDSKVCLRDLENAGEAGLALRNNNRQQYYCLTGAQKSDVCDLWRECLARASTRFGEDHATRILRLIVAALGSIDPVELLKNQGSDMKLLEWKHREGVALLNVNATSMSGQEQVSQDGQRSNGQSVGPDEAAPKNADGSDICLDPETSDPESWDCDCYESMQSRCASIMKRVDDYDETLCLRANFCLHHSVCQGWKDVACINLDDYIDELQVEASRSAVSLLDRSHDRSAVIAEEHAFEQTTAGKSCV